VQAEPANRLLSVTAVVIGEVRTVHQGRVTDKNVAGRIILSQTPQKNIEKLGQNPIPPLGTRLQNGTQLLFRKNTEKCANVLTLLYHFENKY
jgi:hypothetical protein